MSRSVRTSSVSSSLAPCGDVSGPSSSAASRETRLERLPWSERLTESGRSPGAHLDSLDFGPRLDDGDEFRGILFGADF